VVEDTFANIKNSPAEQLVVFYRASDPSHEAILKTVKKVAKKLRHELPPQFAYRKCDGDLEINKKEFQDASFHTGTFVFTSTPIEGIEKYPLSVDVKTLTRYLKGKYVPANDSAVLSFVDEDTFYERLDRFDPPKSIFIKFWEEWCTHCKRAKRSFAQGAQYFRDQVDFMEVQCSKNDETTAFCTRNEVRSYPTFLLFTGEQKHSFTDEVRHIMTFQSFFDKHITPTASSSSPPPTAAVNAATPPATAETDDDSPSPTSEVTDVPVKKDPSKAGTFATPSPAPSPSVAPVITSSQPSISGSAATLEERLSSLELRVRQLEELINTSKR